MNCSHFPLTRLFDRLGAWLAARRERRLRLNRAVHNARLMVAGGVIRRG